MHRVQGVFAALLVFVILCAVALPPQQTRAENSSAADLELMIGQMLIVGFAGTSANDGDVPDLTHQISDGIVGGVMVLKRNIRSPEQVAALTTHLQMARDAAPLFVSIDQEGGRVQRLTTQDGFAEWDAAAYVALLGAGEAPGFTQDYYATRAGELHDLGINLNFGPVVDLNVNPDNPVIGGLDRSFSADPAEVAAASGDFVRGHSAAGVLTAIKHFPGHGSSTTDSHVTLPDISATWTKAELVPYAALAAQGLVDTAMVGHLVHTAYSDGPDVPTSLSHKTYAALREIIGQDAVVLTDDMQMKAVTARFSETEAAIMAINAGADVLIYSTFERIDPEIGPRLNRAIQDAVAKGLISKERIAQSYARIMALKARIGG